MATGGIDDETVTTLAERAEEFTLKNRAMDEAPIGITIADMTAEDEPLVYVNAGFERLTGYPADEAVGANCRFLQGEGTDEESVAAMREAIEAEESVQVELMNYRMDGTPFWNEVTLSPIPEPDGSVEYYLGFQQEVTQRKEYELRLEEQRDDLALLNQLVRHDIRNDLQLVLGYAETLAEEVDDMNHSHVETILDSARHAVELTDTARDMAEVMLTEEGDGSAVSLADHIRPAIEECRSAHEHAEVRVEGAIPDVEVRADELLDSVFDNLLGNAVQHNDTERPELTVSFDVDDESATVRIADNGPGVPDEAKDRVFGRGEKGAASGGTGVGLYLVDTLVSDYGGDVWIEDNEPRGAVFVVSLPLPTDR